MLPNGCAELEIGKKERYNIYAMYSIFYYMAYGWWETLSCKDIEVYQTDHYIEE